MTPIFRDPPEQSPALYPGLCVAEMIENGAITIGDKNFPLWKIVPALLANGADHVMQEYEIEKNLGLDKYEFEYITKGIMFHLLDVRGEFARMLLTLANLQREHRDDNPWWDSGDSCQKMRAALQVCLDSIREPIQENTQPCG